MASYKDANNSKKRMYDISNNFKMCKGRGKKRTISYVAIDNVWS